MASLDSRELEKQLVEAGNKLLQLPSSVDEILSLLDQVENYLSRVEQSPSQSMQTALSPSMKALVADELLRHQDADVKVAVASCISEITRITAPDAPYDDDRMKDIFQLIVSSFENLSDKSSRSYEKRTLILETVAKVRSCVVMLDLECDGLIVEMFQHFLKAIRDDHPDNVFSSMETIMSLVLEESEDISLELISPILASVKRDNQDVPPIARKLAERVVENSAIKLKPYLIQATNSLGFSVDDYTEAISSIFNGKTVAVGRNDNNCGEQLNEESNLARASSDVAVQDENKLAVASPDEAVQLTKDSVPETRVEGDHLTENRSPKSVVSNGVTEAGYVDKKADRESSKEQEQEQEQEQAQVQVQVQEQEQEQEQEQKEEQAHQTDQSIDANATSNGEPDDSSSGKMIKSDTKTEETSKKRGRKKPVINSTEPPDSSRVDSDKEAETTARHGRGLSKEGHTSPSGEPSVEVPVPPKNEKENMHMSSPKELGSKAMDVASPSSSGNVPLEVRSKKVVRAKKKDDLIREDAPSADVSKKASDGTSVTGGKPRRGSGKKAASGPTTEEKTPSLADKSKKRSGKKATAGRTTDVKTPALADKSKSEDGTTSDSEDKPLKLCYRKADTRDNIGYGSSSKNKEDGNRRRRGKAISKNNLTQSTKEDDKEMVRSPKTALNLAKVEGHLEDTPKTSSKRKRGPAKEEASDALQYRDNLIGSRVKVLWPEDEEYYEGVIVSFDPVKKKHKVVYTDNDEEVLNLENETWELVGAGSTSDKEQANECRSPDPPNEMPKKKRAKTNSEQSAKQGKKEGSRGGEASSSKSKAVVTKSGTKSRVEGKFTDDTSKSGDKTKDASGGKSEDPSKKGSRKSIPDGSTTEGKSKDDGSTPKTGSKTKLGSRKANMKDTPKTAPPETASKSKGKATKSGNSSNANGSGKVKETVEKEEESPETVKTPESTEGMSSKGKKTGTKGGKKRRRGAKR